MAGVKLPINELKSEQRWHFRALLWQIGNIDIDEIAEKWELEDELISLKSRWNNIDKLYLKIDSIPGGRDRKCEEENILYEKQYEDRKDILKVKKNIANDSITMPREEQFCEEFSVKSTRRLSDGSRWIQQLAYNDKDKLAAEVLQCQFHVDDLLGKNHSLSDAKEVQKQLIKSSKLQKLLSLSADEINPTTMDLKNANSTKALGLRWRSAATDMFTFHSIDRKKSKQWRVLSENFCHKSPEYLTHWDGYLQSQ